MSVDQHAEVTTPTSRKGDSRRWRINLLNRKSRPICNVMCNSLIFLRFSNIQYPSPQNPCRARAGCAYPALRRAGQPHSRHGHGPGRTGRWPRLSCGRFSPIRCSLTGAAPSLVTPAGRLVRRAAKRRTLYIIMREIWSDRPRLMPHRIEGPWRSVPRRVDESGEGGGLTWDTGESGS